MGIKGDKLTGEAALSAELMVEKLSGISGISSKKMFGGYGIFCNDQMFGIVDSKGKIFLKADDSNRSGFEKSGSEKHSRMPYYSLPENVLNDPDELISWVRQSISITK